MITAEQLDSLIELAARAPKSRSEGLWLQALAQQIVEAQQETQPDPEPGPGVKVAQ